MRFICEHCRTKYSIDDARVRGKVLKIRCKTCSKVITVREETASQHTGQIPLTAAPALEKALDASLGAPTEASFQVPPISPSATVISGAPAFLPEQPEWFVSFEGQSEGPLLLERAVERIEAELDRGREGHGWREGFDGWLPVAAIPEFSRRLKSRVPRPTAPTPETPPSAAASSPPKKRGTTGSHKVREAKSARTPAGRTSGSMEQPTLLDQPAPPVPQLPPSVAAAAQAVPALADLAKSAVSVSIAVPGSTTTLAPKVATPAPASAPLPVHEQMTEKVPRVAPDLLITDASVMAPLPVAARATTPAPVVIVAGPAVRPSPWIKWAAISGGVAIVALVGTIAYLLSGPRTPSTPTFPMPSLANSHEVDDRPAAAFDPGGVPQPMATVTPLAGKHAAHRPAPASAKTTPAPPPTKPASSSSPSGLAAMYAEQSKNYDLPTVGAHPQHAAEVSETQLAEVVQRNRRSLSLCYDRLLKRDTSMKAGRVDVEVSIGISGSVIRVNLGHGAVDPELSSCMTQAIRRWRFPASGAEYGFNFPLVLQGQ